MGQNTRKVSIGELKIGGGNPVVIQTMWKTPLPKIDQRQINEINQLRAYGCPVLRFAVPDQKSAEALCRLLPDLNIKAVADIHFDYKLALTCISGGIDKVRINPGNIGAEWKVKEVLTAAKDAGTPIRIGINGGSLPAGLRHLPKVEAMLASAEQEIELLHKYDFHHALFSLKSSDLKETLEANRQFSKRWDYPLHIGITEAGPMIPGIVQSSIALNRLLEEGIGDTLRVSLSDSPLSEVITGREILRASGMGKQGVQIISCPKCGRASFDEENKFIKELTNFLYQIDKDIKVAVMGCVVNGPEEAKHADLGITGAGNSIIIFKGGQILCKVPKAEAFDRLLKEIQAF